MAREVVAAFTADNHLRPDTWARHPTLLGDAYCSWRQIIQYCVDRGIDLWQLGDLFDSSRPDPMSVAVYLEGVGTLRANDLYLSYIEGNHERAAVPWASLGGPGVQRAGRFSAGGLEIYGLDFTNRSQLAERLQNVPQTDILLTHQSWYEMQHVGSADARFAMLPRSVVMLAGDFHMTNMWQGAAADGGLVTAYSPGSTSLQALNEPAEKYFGLLYSDRSVEWVRLVTRQLGFLQLRTQDELDAAVDGIQDCRWVDTTPKPPEIQKPILRVVYDDKLPDAYVRLMAAAGDNYHVFLEPRRVMDTTVVTVTEDRNFSDLQTAVAELAGPNDMDAVRAALRLLGSTEPKPELQTMFKEFEPVKTEQS